MSGAIGTFATRPARRLGVQRAPHVEIPGPTDVSISVAAGADDARELDGAMDLTNAILRMGSVPGGLVGYRFLGVPAVNGATMMYVFIQFAAAGGGGAPAVLRIQAQAADNAGAFTSATNDISNRTLTTAYVDWSPGAWEGGQSDAATRTPDLSAVMQEVVNRAGWASGNAVVFVVSLSPANTGTEAPSRKAASYESTFAAAAILQIGPGLLTPARPSGSFTDGYDLFGLEANEAFDPSSPTLKDGTPITGQMLTDYNAAMYWVMNANDTSGDWSLVNLTHTLGRADSYNNARDSEKSYPAMLHMFRLTGDRRILDRICDALAAQVSVFTIPWEGSSWVSTMNSYTDHWATGGVGNPWSPYGKILYRGAGGAHYTEGTNLNRLNENKLITMAAQFAWLLWVNRNKASPAGHDYGNLYTNTWKGIVEDYVSEWMGDYGAGFDEGNESTWDWRANFRGDEWSSPASGTTSSGNPLTGRWRRRAPTGQWPMFAENGSHPAQTGVVQHRYLGLLGVYAGANIPNASVAFSFARPLLEAIRTFAFKTQATDWGTGVVSTRSKWFRDGDDRAGWTGYIGGIAAQALTIWLTGDYREDRTIDGVLHRGYTLTHMRQWARAYAHTHFPNGNYASAGNEVTYGNLLSGILAAGHPNDTGLTSDSDTNRTARQQSLGAYFGMLPFADGGAFTRLETHARDCQQDDAGGYSTPDSGLPAASLFIHAALQAVGDTP